MYWSNNASTSAFAGSCWYCVAKASALGALGGGGVTPKSGSTIFLTPAAFRNKSWALSTTSPGIIDCAWTCASAARFPSLLFISSTLVCCPWVSALSLTSLIIFSSFFFSTTNPTASVFKFKPTCFNWLTALWVSLKFSFIWFPFWLPMYF